MSLLEQNGRVIIHTFGDGDWRVVREDLRARGLLADDTPGQARSVAPEWGDNLSRQRRRQAAEDLWSQGRPITGALSERHCRLRGLAGPLPDEAALRHHGLTPLSVYRPGPATRPEDGAPGPDRRSEMRHSSRAGFGI